MVVPRPIDVIVVNKVDRPTRLLADFAKLLELFEAHGVSFNSVTQAFNTITLMGRLTPNMPLSFARFERQIPGERIRDKVERHRDGRRRAAGLGELVQTLDQTIASLAARDGKSERAIRMTRPLTFLVRYACGP